MKLIASAIVDTDAIDFAALKQAGFILDSRFPTYVQPIQGTCIQTTPTPDGRRLYEQFRED